MYVVVDVPIRFCACVCDFVGMLACFFMRNLDEEDTTHKEYASSLTVRQPLKGTTIEVISSVDDERVIIPTRQLPTSSKEPESNSTFESVEESCPAGVENSVFVYASTVPNSNIPYNGYFSGESSLGTRNVPPIVSPAIDEKYKFTPVAGKPHSFFKWLATIEEGSTHEEYGSSHTVRQPLKGSAVNVKGSIDGEKVFNPTRQQSLPKNCEAKESCPPGDDESVVSNAPGHKSGFSLSSFIPSWSRPKTGGSQKGWKLTLGNLSTGFIPGAATKGNRIYLLAFEVANTIVKGATLMQSLSKENIEHLKEVVLPSEGVQYLVSKDRKDLLRIAAADKREELKIFSGEVVCFGNRCKDPQWHNLHSYFEKMGGEVVTQKPLKEEAETVMQKLMTMAQYTAELYHELHALDRFEQDYQRKLQEEDNSSAAQRGDSLAILREELKSQQKHVRSLKKKSLWSKILEEVMEKLVDAVYFLHLEIHDAFGSADTKKPLKGSQNNHQRLGPAGLALHYANTITQIDTLVSRSSYVPPNTRDTLYQGLPPSVKSALRSKLRSFEVKEELTVTQIKAEMEKILQWLVPIATNTTKAHHSFGWVGEWANTVSEVNRKAAGQTELIKIETLHYADKEKTEACILELIVWLHHTTKSPTRVPTQKTIPLEIFPVRRFPVIDFDMDWNVIEAGSPE
ncbi:hypothetical protein IFM89_009853 [Coptis chinensis]|uniref:DUF668 domain-containing protein n=1 Tax=Coptis chinensis TaxID=261450 RepID=A0A835I2H4_9MAGN|nr:hypothetical protein IFM89_009853 [Coptis chinensis]